MGRSAAELRERVIDAPHGCRTAMSPASTSTARPAAYRLLDLATVRAVAAPALHIKLEPRFLETSTPGAARHGSMGARLGPYLEPGHDRYDAEDPALGTSTSRRRWKNA